VPQPTPGEVLDDGLARLGLPLAPDRVEALLRYLELLGKWSRTYNLTAVRHPATMVVRHLLDSLAVSGYVSGGRLLDVGTGPGLPGMVLAIARPALHCVLLDANGKKTRFCIQAAAVLGLSNVEVVQARIETYRSRQRFSSVTARAFGTVRELVDLTAPLCAPDGRVLAMKGAYPAAEIGEVARVQECAKVIPLFVPGLDAERHLVVVDMGCVKQHTPA